MKELISRFSPYLMKYKGMLALDLFCAALTTLCDIALPRIMSRLTNTAMTDAAALTAQMIMRMALLYFVLRINLVRPAPASYGGSKSSFRPPGRTGGSAAWSNPGAFRHPQLPYRRCRGRLHSSPPQTGFCPGSPHSSPCT